MPTSPNLMAERFAEVRAVAAIQSVVRILDDYSREPSGKRFVNSRLARKERWAQLAQEAAIRVNELSEPRSPLAKRIPKPKKPIGASASDVGGFVNESEPAVTT